VIKVSEYASWSIRYYKRIIDGCLDAVGAPRDLVQFVVGYGATGSALVTSGVDKVVDRRYRQLIPYNNLGCRPYTALSIPSNI
jgi:hypothetical protein